MKGARCFSYPCLRGPIEDTERFCELGGEQTTLHVFLHNASQVRDHDPDDAISPKHPMALSEDPGTLFDGKVFEGVRTIHDINT
jgi:hypothetical protein